MALKRLRVVSVSLCTKMASEAGLGYIVMPAEAVGVSPVGTVSGVSLTTQ